MTLKSGTRFEGLKMRKDVNQDDETERTETTKSPNRKAKDKGEDKPKYTPPKPYKPPIPFPQRLTKAKLDREIFSRAGVMVTSPSSDPSPAPSWVQIASSLNNRPILYPSCDPSTFERLQVTVTDAVRVNPESR